MTVCNLKDVPGVDKAALNDGPKFLLIMASTVKTLV